MESIQVKTKELRPLKDSDKDYEEVERRIRQLFKKEIYLPIVEAFDLKDTILLNAKPNGNYLIKAIKSGRIQFYKGTFSGRLGADISRELKALGAKWDVKTRTFKLPQSSLSMEVKAAISASESNFRAKIAEVDSRLSQILPEEIADKLKIEAHLDSTLWKVDRELSGSLEGVAITAQLSPVQRRRLAVEWQNNMKLWIKDFAQKEIVSLRQNVQQSVFAGDRNERLQKVIRSSYDVAINKAKFLARQETRLLLTKFKQTRYEDAGVEQYRWGCANRPHQAKGAPYKKGEVRHDHGVLEGRIFSWKNPPITDDRGSRNNPGQDYNCRCYVVPIVKFKK